MSNIKPDDLRRQAAEEEFFRLAAMEIESEQNEEFLEAQSLPDPAPEVLQRMQTRLQKTMRKTQKRRRHHTILLYMGRLTACAAIVCCVLISGTYFGVDAARNSINNFVLEMFDTHASIKTGESEPFGGASLPVDWQGPFRINWVPPQFTSIQTFLFDYSWQLQYSDEENPGKGMTICVWDAASSPNIDIEDSSIIEEIEIQDAVATIYSKSDKDTYNLLWAKDNYVVVISGQISLNEIIKVAQNISF